MLYPNRAGCKIGFRLAQGQEPGVIMDLAARHIRNRLPEGITAKIIPYPFSAEAYVFPLKHPAVRVLEIDQRIYGKEPKFLRSGERCRCPVCF